MKVIQTTSNVTYRNLVQRVDHAQENYDDIRDRKGLRQRLEKAALEKKQSQSGVGLDILADDDQSQH